MPKLELDKIVVTQLTRLLPQERRKGRHWSRAHKVSTCMYVCLCSTAPRWSCATFLNQECLQAAWLPRSNLSWSCTSLLSLLSSDRKVVCRSRGGETRPNRRAIDGCRLRVRSKAYSASSHKRGKSRNLLLQTDICAAELATWGVGPDVNWQIEINEVGIDQMGITLCHHGWVN